jgi:GGDEF domain-containing protein
MENRRRLDGGQGSTLWDAPRERRKTADFYDGRTGLASRSLFRDRTEHALQRSARSETRLALVVLEMEPDTAPLRNNKVVTKTLLKNLRSYDTAAELEDNYIGVLLEDVPGTSVAQGIRRRLEAALPACRASSVAVSDSRGRIGFWMGAAH